MSRTAVVGQIRRENKQKLTTEDTSAIFEFNLKKAIYLSGFANECIDKEYPNKTGHVMGDSTYLATPRELHPAFYGCFDWHSSVHGHWALVKILDRFPEFEQSAEILDKIRNNLTAENIVIETTYLDDEFNKDFERTYGWAWLVKLDEALAEWDHPEAAQLRKNLGPLVDKITVRFTEFIDKLNYPIRVGEHTNTAFALSFAFDYAGKYSPVLASKITEKARIYYLNDKGCPLTWEPGGFDFLSPCLQEATLMQKVLGREEFELWFAAFMPGFAENPADYLQIAEVSDPTDGKLVHLYGLNFSRAWCLFELGKSLNNKKMTDLAWEHFNYSYSKMDSGEYAGAHWLASFALVSSLRSECSSLRSE
jgi:hypothetical protein